MAKLSLKCALAAVALSVSIPALSSPVSPDDLSPEMRAAYERISKSMSQKKDQAMQDSLNRDKELKAFVESQVGGELVDPMSAQPSLTIFVSLSMPSEIIEAYAKEAAVLGGNIVVRGIPAGWTLGDYMKNVLWPYAQRGTPLAIDPPLFDRYGVTAVPTIVWEPRRENPNGCGKEVKAHTVEYLSQSVDVTQCEKIPSDHYWSMQGAVTVAWALDQMDQSGAPGAKEALNKLMDGNTGAIMQEVQPVESGDSLPSFLDIDATMETPNSATPLLTPKGGA